MSSQVKRFGRPGDSATVDSVIVHSPRLIVALCCLLSLPASARTVPRALWAQAEPQNPAYGAAKAQLERGDFQGAVRTLNEGLSQPDLTDEQLADLYQLLGLAQLYLGDKAAARDAFERLLQARPDYDLPDSEPPKIRALYARIKEDIKHRRVLPVRLEITPISEATPGSPVTLQAQVENLSLGARPHLYYRRAGAQAYSSVEFLREKGTRDRFTATLGAAELPPEPRAYEVEYYVEVSDAAERRLAGAGDAYNPLTFRVSAAEVAEADDSPWYKSPWVWVVGGAVAAGAAVGIVAAATSRQTGTLDLTISVSP
jgi:tetratricopeptide (TPR) repeat protein